MAVTQYIGARYVPKFYLNSDGNADWRSGVEYEALTVVTWNSNSYISKKHVPAGIGNPSDNPIFWVCISNFSQQVSDLSTQVAQLAALITSGVKYYDSVAAMVADASTIEPGMLVITSGYYESNDGGGAAYYITADAPETYYERIGIYYAELIADSLVNVKQFGAYGDGLHSDSAAILEAFKYDTVYFPSGTYVCSSKIQYRSGQTVYGENRESTTLYISNLGTGFTSASESADDGVILNFKMHDIRIKYPGANRTAPAVVFHNSRRLTIDHCIFQVEGEGGANTHVLIDKDDGLAGCWSHRFYNNYFYMARVSIMKNTDSWFVNNDINALGQEYALRLQDTGGMYISGNQFIGCLELNNANANQIVDNYFDGYVAHNNPARWDAIKATGLARKSIIDSNRFYEIPGRCIYFAYTAGPQDTTISNNTFENCDAFNDGVPDIDFGTAGASTPALITGNSGTRYTYWILADDGTVTTGVRPATAPFAAADGGSLSLLVGNVIHNGYAPTQGDHFKAIGNSPTQLFATHHYGDITSTNPVNVYDVMGSILKFDGAQIYCNTVPAIIRGKYHTVELTQSGQNVLITAVYNLQGGSVTPITGYSVSVDSPR